MKKFLFLLTLLLLPAHVFADDGIYLKGNMGIFSMEDSTLNLEGDAGDIDIGEVSSDIGFSINTAIGKSFANGFDLELEYGFKTASLDEATPSDEFAEAYKDAYGEDISDYKEDVDGNIDIHSLMVNAIYNLNNQSSITPYVGGGIGVGFTDVEDSSDTVFAYQVIAGVAFNLSKNVDILVAYRYFGTDDISEEGTFDGYDIEGSASVDSHNFEAGFKYSF